MPVIDGQRAHLIAALHILINWLIDHPGVPVPSVVRMIAWNRDQGTAELQELAATLQGEWRRSDDAQWINVPIPVGDQGVDADYACFGATPPAR